MRNKLLGVFFTLSIVSTPAYSDQPAVVIDFEMSQQITNFSNMYGLVSYENPGVSGGGTTPSGGGSCGDLAECDGGVSRTLNLSSQALSIETDSLVSRALFLLGTVSDVNLGDEGPRLDLGPGVRPIPIPSPGPSCLVGDCGPGVGSLALIRNINPEDLNMVNLAAERLGLIESSALGGVNANALGQ